MFSKKVNVYVPVPRLQKDGVLGWNACDLWRFEMDLSEVPFVLRSPGTNEIMRFNLDGDPMQAFQFTAFPFKHDWRLKAKSGREQDRNLPRKSDVFAVLTEWSLPMDFPENLTYRDLLEEFFKFRVYTKVNIWNINVRDITVNNASTLRPIETIMADGDLDTTREEAA